MAKKKEIEAGDVSQKLTDLREQLRKIRFSLAGARPKNVKEERNIKKEIARLLTAQRTMGTK